MLYIKLAVSDSGKL